MARVKNPTTLSGYFGLSRRALDGLDVLDITLAIDTRLFIDPLLFQHSRHDEIRRTAVAQYRSHFEKVIRFLSATTRQGDVAWRTARRLLAFHEIRGTCLGYGAASIYGSGFGYEMTDRLLRVGKEIVDLGITDPDLFPAMALFEAGIGPDRISDMATNAVLGALMDFNTAVLKELRLKGEPFDIAGLSGSFLRNPFQARRTPIILVPKDILRKLPVARDWDEIADAAARNEALRNRVNQHIGHIWAEEAKRDIDELKRQALANFEAFQTLLDAMHAVLPIPYSVDRDPDGLIKWAHIAREFAEGFPLDLTQFRHPADLESVTRLVGLIIERFRQLIENNGLNKELYTESGAPRHESTAQRLFFAVESVVKGICRKPAINTIKYLRVGKQPQSGFFYRLVAYSYCHANNVDISPEVDSGSGQVDFKLSRGAESRVLVEIKLSANPKLVHGYGAQLEIYKKAEATTRAFYLVIDVGRMGKKVDQLTKLKNDASSRGEPLSELVFIDGTIKPSASKR
ncbi:MAG: hypothetical protein V1694_06025 [Candidatus Eisenbacteria bacterium]